MAPWLPVPRPLAAPDVAVRALALPAGPSLVGVTIDPAIGRAFVTDDAGAVWALDERSGRLLGPAEATTPATGAPSGAMAADATRHRVYLATLGGGLALLDGRSGALAPPWTVKRTFGLAIDGVADRVLVTQPDARALAALDAGTGQVVAMVPLAAPAFLVAADAPARRVYVAAATTGRLDVLDADTYRSIATVALPGPAGALAVDAKAHRVYAAVPLSGAIAALDGRSGAILATLHIGAAPLALAVNPATGHLFVAEADGVAVVDPRRGAVVATVPVAAQPVAVAADPQTGLVYVADGAAGAATMLADDRAITVFRDRSGPPTPLAG